MTRVNAGQVRYKDGNDKTQILDVFHYKDGSVRAVRRGGLPGVQGDILVFENGNFTKLPNSLIYEFFVVGEDKILKDISKLVQSSLEGQGGNSNGWTKPAWLEGGLEGNEATDTDDTSGGGGIPASTSTDLEKDYGAYDTFLGAKGKAGENPKSAQYPIDALYYSNGTDNVAAGGRTGKPEEEGQDHLVISQYKYKVPRAEALFGEDATPSNLLTTGLTRNSPLEKFLGLVRLPMPNDITDSNNVKWGEDVMNAIEAAGIAQWHNADGWKQAAAAAAQVGGNVAGADGLGGAVVLGDILANQSGGPNALKETFNAEITSRILAMAGIEASAASILARGKGVIPNSNLELLFQAPMLREFQFNYRMSPRSDSEARVVNHIVRFFKQGMAAKKQTAVSGTGASYFLGTPNVFRLQYRTANNAAPEGVNRIKTCALTGTSVNYTPEGAWAAYEGGQPVSIMLSMRFQELEPVYDTDYAPYDEDDENIRNEDGNDLSSRWSINSSEVGY